jgi:hypothetical protein
MLSEWRCILMPFPDGDKQRDRNLVFSDSDLKRLKAQLSGDLPLFSIWSQSDLKVLMALLARLEAAENTILRGIELDDSIALGSSSDLETHNNLVGKAKQAMDEWRMASGK